MSRVGLLAIALVCLAAPSAEAAPLGVSSVLWDEETPRNYVNLRVGAASGQTVRRPQMCLEVTPIVFVSGEACGNGSGFLHQDPEPEIAHFRLKLNLASIQVGHGFIQPQLGGGFAELQVGEDDQGFNFGGPSHNLASTAGPEAGGALRGVVPVVAGFELIVEMRLFLAYFAHAPRLRIPQQVWQPTLGFSLGAGF